MTSKIKSARQYLILYAERLEIIAPRMITSPTELRRFLKLHGYKRLRRNKRVLGTAWHTCGVIWINLRSHNNNWQLRHTIAHELIHMKYRIPHGKRFEEKITQVINNRVR